MNGNHKTEQMNKLPPLPSSTHKNPAPHLWQLCSYQQFYIYTNWARKSLLLRFWSSLNLLLVLHLSMWDLLARFVFLYICIHMKTNHISGVPRGVPRGARWYLLTFLGYFACNILCLNWFYGCLPIRTVLLHIYCQDNLNQDLILLAKCTPKSLSTTLEVSRLSTPSFGTYRPTPMTSPLKLAP